MSTEGGGPSNDSPAKASSPTHWPSSRAEAEKLQEILRLHTDTIVELASDHRLELANHQSTINALTKSRDTYKRKFECIVVAHGEAAARYIHQREKYSNRNATDRATIAELHQRISQLEYELSVFHDQAASTPPGTPAQDRPSTPSTPQHSS